jgi:hypothetical protein
LSLSYTYSLTDNLNYYGIKGANDGYISFGVGISFSNEIMNTDEDHDGLTRGQEMNLLAECGVSGTNFPAINRRVNPSVDGLRALRGEEFESVRELQKNIVRLPRPAT